MQNHVCSLMVVKLLLLSLVHFRAEKKLIKSIAETFKILFEQTVIDDERVFLSTYYFLKNEIYDSNISNGKD